MLLSLDEKLRRLRTDPAWRTISLPVDIGSTTREQVLVEALASGEFRIASSPGMIEGLATDDVVVEDATVPQGYRLVRRGGNLCIHMFLEQERLVTLKPQLDAAVASLGGVLDGTMGRTGLCYTIPLAAGFDPVKAAFNGLAGSNWYFSNVYDMQTNEPLNWWLGR